jgi:hypothetical protein
MTARLSSTREAGASIKPGVERSGTPGTAVEKIRSPRSGRQRKHYELRLVIATAIGRFAGYGYLSFLILGFRFAPPQALC